MTKKKNNDHDHLNLLPDGPGLDVVCGSLQLRVRHKCGTSHLYALNFEVTDEEGLESQLNEDLSYIIDFVRNRVHEGEIHVNGRKYIASEITTVDDPIIESLYNRYPVIVLPPKVKIVLGEKYKTEDHHKTERPVSHTVPGEKHKTEELHKGEHLVSDAVPDKKPRGRKSSKHDHSHKSVENSSK